MSRNLPPPATVNDFYLSTVLDVLDEAVGLLRVIRDRLSEPASVKPAGGPGTATPQEAPVSTVDGTAADEAAEPKPKPGAVAVSEPKPVKAAKTAAKKTLPPKPVKES